MISLKGMMKTMNWNGKQVELGKVYSSPYATAFKPMNEGEGEDHEVSMAQNSLDTIIKMATELKSKMGETEKDIPAWIQDHITNAENFISQASSNYHEYKSESVNEAEVETPRGDVQVLKVLNDIVKNHSALKVKDQKTGKVMMVDVQSANAVLKLYDALSSTNKSKYINSGMKKMIDFAWDVMGKR
jgi:hypothetical protein